MGNETPGAHPGDPQPGRSGRRTLFRVLGVLFMGIAVTLIASFFYDFFTWDQGAPADPGMPFDVNGQDAMEWVDEGPTTIWMLFVGGAIFLNLGFAGAHARYLAGEYSPGLRTVSRDLRLGGDRGRAGTGAYRRSCGTQNDADARFCDSCGTPMGA